MSARKIIVYDSGAGGLASLARLSDAGAAEEFEYFAGMEHMPYGEKSAAELREFVNDDVARLLERAGAGGLLLIACNTACTALNAAHAADARVVKISDLTRQIIASAPPQSLLLCTRATLLSGIYAAPVGGYVQAAPELVMAAERAEFATAAKIIAALREDFPAAKQIIAGCTHFGLLAPEIAAAGYVLLDPVSLLIGEISGTGGGGGGFAAALTPPDGAENRGRPERSATNAQTAQMPSTSATLTEFATSLTPPDGAEKSRRPERPATAALTPPDAAEKPRRPERPARTAQTPAKSPSNPPRIYFHQPQMQKFFKEHKCRL